MPAAILCPECASPNTRGLEEISRATTRKYFRCDDCGEFWIADSEPSAGESPIQQTGHPVADFFDVGRNFLNADLEIGLLFAKMAKAEMNAGRREQLRRKATVAYQTVLKYRETISIPPEEHSRVVEQLSALKVAIDAIPQD